MSRKKLKLILLIAGIAVLAAGLVVFIIDISGFSSLRPRGFKSLMNEVILPFYVFALIGIIALSIAAFLHSNDIHETRRSLSVVLKTFACFWIAGGVLSAAAFVSICIFIMR